MASFIKAETKPVQPECYPEGLAYAIHFTVTDENGTQTALNCDYGILFAEGEINEKNEIVPAYFKEPWLVEKNGHFYVGATWFAEKDGIVEERDVFFETEDFISFGGCEESSMNAICIDGVRKRNEIEIPDAIAEAAILYWNKVYNTEVRVPEKVTVANKDELERVTATAVYNDGSVHNKKVEWNTDGIDFTVAGEYHVKGKAVTPKYGFPLAKDTGDPVLLQRDGYWYFLYTHDSNGDIGLYLRRAKKISDLFDGRPFEETILLDVDEEKNFIQTFWAPEFHTIGGWLYILFAVGGKVWGPQCHMMYLKEDGDVFNPSDWSVPCKVLRTDGLPLAPGGITLDMTYIETVSGSYLAWSERYHCMSEGDSGSMVCIAKTNLEEPWRLTSEPVILTRPLYGFENVSGTINNEGPYAFQKDGKVYLTYSGGSANRYTYTLGLLTIDGTKDLTELTNWEKSPTAVLHFHNTPGRFGAGHNSFFTDEDGNFMIAYHGETDITSSLRCTGMNRVHFDKTGRPRFDMMPEEDLKEELAEVEMVVYVKL